MPGGSRDPMESDYQSFRVSPTRISRNSSHVFKIIIAVILVAGIIGILSVLGSESSVIQNLLAGALSGSSLPMTTPDKPSLSVPGPTALKSSAQSLIQRILLLPRWKYFKPLAITLFISLVALTVTLSLVFYFKHSSLPTGSEMAPLHEQETVEQLEMEVPEESDFLWVSRHPIWATVIVLILSIVILWIATTICLEGCPLGVQCKIINLKSAGRSTF
jgi:hypothetical protein